VNIRQQEDYLDTPVKLYVVIASNILDNLLLYSSHRKSIKALGLAIDDFHTEQDMARFKEEIPEKHVFVSGTISSVTHGQISIFRYKGKLMGIPRTALIPYDVHETIYKTGKIRL